MDKSSSIQCVFLNDRGIKALSHLSDVYLREGNILDCHDILYGNSIYLEVKAQPQRELPYDALSKILVHLLIPHGFVDVIVLDEPDIHRGFVQE